MIPLYQQVCSTKEFRTLRGGGNSAIHKWLSIHFGRANRCENKKCRGVSSHFVWAKRRGKPYAHKRSNFWRLCTSCHTAYDMTDIWREKIRVTSRKRRCPEEVRKKISASCKGRVFSTDHRQKLSESKIGNKNSCRKPSL